MINDEKIRVVFIKTSAGERVLFYGTLNADYLRLRNIFLDLATGRATEVCLNDISLFLVQKNLIVKMIVQDKCKTLAMDVNSNPNMQAIHWIMDSENWKYCYDYLEGFDTANMSCHQYLAFNDFSIVPTISKGEYNDDTFKGFF